MKEAIYSIDVDAGRDLRGLNSFGVPASAPAFTSVHSPREIEAIARAFDPDDLLILGGGSNMLFIGNPQKFVLHNQLIGRGIMSRTGNTAIVAAAGGENWHDLVTWSLKMGLGGLENLSLIPGSVGAAPMQNIGAYGVELSDVLHRVRAMDLKTGKWVLFDAGDCGFGYRTSRFKTVDKGRYFIAEVQLQLTIKEHTAFTSYGAIKQELAIRNITKPTPADISTAVVAIRKRKLPDPKKLGNAGSFFKNPIVLRKTYQHIRERFPDLKSYPVDDQYVKIPAAWLIENTGWKGKRVGQVGTSPKHALVLVNHGKGTGQEIWALARQIKASVLERFGVELEPEVNLIGDLSQ